MSSTDDQRAAEDAQMVEEALHCAETGSAGHWPTAAGFLAEEVYRLRAELAETRRRADELSARASEFYEETIGLRAAGDALAVEVMAMLTGPVPVSGDWWPRLAPKVNEWRSVCGDAPTVSDRVGDDQPDELAEAVTNAITRWIATELNITDAGIGLSPGRDAEEVAQHQLIDQLCHVDLAGIDYRLTPKIMALLRARDAPTPGLALSEASVQRHQESLRDGQARVRLGERGIEIVPDAPAPAVARTDGQPPAEDTARELAFLRKSNATFERIVDRAFNAIPEEVEAEDDDLASYIRAALTAAAATADRPAAVPAGDTAAPDHEFPPGTRVWSSHSGAHGVVVAGPSASPDRVMVEFDGDDGTQWHVKRDVLHPSAGGSAPASTDGDRGD